MKSVAIITARGGSKRIPRKNIKSFCGKPIIEYSINAAINSNMFDEVMVSTDDLEIKEIAERCGARVPFLRSKLTSNDISSTSDVLFEVLDEYKKIGLQFEFMCCIYPTAPFITSSKLMEGMTLLYSKKADCVLPIVPFSFPPQRGFVIENQIIKYKWPENMLVRSQDLERMYHDSGQFYCMRVSSFYEQKTIVMNNTLPIILSEIEVQDIDNEDDWIIAEIKYRNSNKNK